MSREATMPDAYARRIDAAALAAEEVREQMRYAPHLLFLRQAERVDISMAESRDPYPAFAAWESALATWAWEDPLFLAQAPRIEQLLGDVARRYGPLPRLEYVRVWRPLYFGVMKRAGMFPRMENEERPEASGAAHGRIQGYQGGS